MKVTVFGVTCLCMVVSAFCIPLPKEEEVKLTKEVASDVSVPEVKAEPKEEEVKLTKVVPDVSVQEVKAEPKEEVKLTEEVVPDVSVQEVKDESKEESKDMSTAETIWPIWGPGYGYAGKKGAIYPQYWLEPQQFGGGYNPFGVQPLGGSFTGKRPAYAKLR